MEEPLCTDKWERELADEMLTTYELPKLVDFLSGNFSPSMSYAQYCSEENLPKLFDAVVAAACLEQEIFAEDLLAGVVSGLQMRYATAVPEEVRYSFLRSIKNAVNAARATSGGQESAGGCEI